MPDPMPPRIFVAALSALLLEALEQEETQHLAGDRFKADLRALNARVEDELETHAGRTRLRVADEPDRSVADD